jgi:DNA helicase II / ATP-dependent DNA helicase PcrA
MTTSLVKGLNPEQARAVEHIDGPLLIFAGAGSGKTRVIVHRVAHLIHQGVNPYKILCLTFTNKAANEMKLRLQTLLGQGDIPVWAGTFHSFGARFLRFEAGRIGYPSSFAIYDEADQRSLISKCMKELGVTLEKGKDSRVGWLINMGKDTVRDISEIPVDLNFDPVPVAQLYELRKKASGAFDFADLIYVPYTMLSTMPDLKEKYQSRFTHVLVDEYQDTNMAQYKLLMELVCSHNNICVVGDDDQSIYGWRGANVGNILRFKEDFPGANVITLEQNYRSTEDILKAASNLISNNRYRAPKNLKSACGKGNAVCITEFSDHDDEAQHVAYTVSRLIDSGVSPSDIGVFYRVNALSRVLEESFVRRSLAYAVYGGMRFYERREVKDLLAYLRVIANPADEEAFARSVNTPARGIGEKSLDSLRIFARSKRVPTLEAIDEALEQKVIKSAAARGAFTFKTLMEDLKKRVGLIDVADMLELIVDRIGFKQYLSQEVDGQDRITNVNELIASASGITDLTEYLQEKALMSSMDLSPGEKVSVMTLHMSKGLEFDYVFIVGCEEGLLPHSRSMDADLNIEEERRLLYVGITRARKQVSLSWARVRALYGREVYQIPSGFLRELDL